MTRTIPHSSRRRRAGRAIATTLGMALALTGAGPAIATVPVVDLPHTIKTAIGWVEAHAQDLREVQQWQREIAHYRQQLTTAARFVDRSLAMSDRFEQRAADHGMAEACPGATGLPALWSPGALDPRGDIRAQQLLNCQRIVLARNARYNEQVALLRRIRENDATLRQLGAARAQAGERQGALAANDNDIARFFARAETDMAYARSAIAAYDGLVVEFEQAQAQLARLALEGEGAGSLGGIVQGVVLRGALEAARGRDR